MIIWKGNLYSCYKYKLAYKFSAISIVFPPYFTLFWQQIANGADRLISGEKISIHIYHDDPDKPSSNQTWEEKEEFDIEKVYTRAQYNVKADQKMFSC